MLSNFSIRNLLKETFIDWLVTLIRYSRPSLWSSHREKPLKKQVYEVTYELTLEAAETKVDSIEIRTTKTKKLVNRQKAQQVKGINPVDSCSWGKLMHKLLNEFYEAAAVYTDENTIFQRNAPTTLNSNSELFIDCASCCTFGIQQTPRTTAWKMIPGGLQRMFINACHENFKAPYTCIKGFYEPCKQIHSHWSTLRTLPTPEAQKSADF